MNPMSLTNQKTREMVQMRQNQMMLAVVSQVYFRSRSSVRDSIFRHEHRSSCFGLLARDSCGLYAF